MSRALHWFRSDLRVTDNTALQAAMRQAQQLTTVMLLTPETWKKHHRSPRQIQLILRSLEQLADTLAKRGIPLIVIEVSTDNDCASMLMQLCHTHNIQQLYFNKQYEVDEETRDETVINALTSVGVTCHPFHDQAIVTPGKITTQSGNPYKVFTPFKKAWLNEVTQQQRHYQASPQPKTSFKTNRAPAIPTIPTSIKGFSAVTLGNHIPIGEHQAQHQLATFAKTHLADYHRQRDYPALTGTSQLSPALAIGTLSPRQCLSTILEATHARLDDNTHFPGELSWLNELIWRDFYKHLLFFYPRLSKHQAFQTATERLPWGNDPQLLQAWQQGKTGFPLVDAAMRQLNLTGWMHNRLRMVSAMFFTKTLFLDWRLGEQYFMQQLIDGDLSANNGGWQWCASTGTDAAPYFRIFNPTRQSERFDPEGTFIRSYCPELSHLSNKQIHAPYENGIAPGTLDYPGPIVNYKQMRAHVIEQFKTTLQEGKA